MAGEDRLTDRADHLMLSLQPFLCKENDDTSTNSFNKMSTFNTPPVLNDNSSTGHVYPDRVAQPNNDNLFYQYESFEHIAERPRLESQSSIVDGLLSEIYDRWQDHKHDSFDSDTFTECSSTSEVAHWRGKTYINDTFSGNKHIRHFHPALLQEYSITELQNLVGVLTRYVNQMSARLVRQLKRRERRMSKVQNNCDIVTAIIQASSPKRRIDTRMRFTVEPTVGDSAFDQWKDAMKAVARLPLGIPDEFRKKVWLSMADQYIHDLKIDWDRTVKVAFNERSNPDDNKLGLQIVKDLHRTGCSGFSGEDNEEERALLKRILLAYARWNKTVGYCQGFNVIAALLLDVMDRKEADAFKVMIYLIDHVLPQSYFANNLRALSVDMAVFRDLLKIFPKLSKHLDYLQHAQDQMSGGCYEPPLTNVFTMQWFLTLFATCLPKGTTLRVWDAIMLDGSEILLRTALVIWGKLSSRILTVNSADEFYTLMGDITQEMLEGKVLDPDSMIKSIYSIAPFPFPQLTELREKYTYNIRPFTPASKRTWADGSVLPSDEDDLEDEDIEAITCFTGFIPVNAATGVKQKALEGDQRTGSIPDIASLGPGAYSLGPADGSGLSNTPAFMERMTTDISALKKQYVKLRQRQRQAHIILTTASAKQQALKTKPMMPTIESPRALNHLFINKQAVKGRNRLVAAGPRIASLYPLGIPSTTSAPGQPVQPQVIGNTKCKWIQKSSNDDKKNGIMKKTTSAPNNLSNMVDNENNNNSNSNARLSPVSSIGQQNQNKVNDVKVDKESRVGKEIDTSTDSSSAEEASEHITDTSNTETEQANSDLIKDGNNSHSESSTEQVKQCDDDAEDTSVDTSEPMGEMGNKLCGASVEGAIDTTEDSEGAGIKGEGPNVSDKDILIHSDTTTTGASVHDTDHVVTDNELAQNDTDTSQNITTATTEQAISVTQLTETVSTKSPTKKKCAMLDTAKAASYSASSSNGASCRVKSPASAGEYSHDKSFEQYYNTKRNLTINSGQSAETGLKKFPTSKKAFNPFPVLHMNQNRAKTGIRLGLYKQSTLEEFEKNLKNQPVWGK